MIRFEIQGFDVSVYWGSNVYLFYSKADTFFSFTSEQEEMFLTLSEKGIVYTGDLKQVNLFKGYMEKLNA